MEGVVLGFDSGVLDHASGIGLETRHGAADVGVYFYDLFDGRGDKEGGGDALFDAEENAMGGGDLSTDGVTGSRVRKARRDAYAYGC